MNNYTDSDYFNSDEVTRVSNENNLVKLNISETEAPESLNVEEKRYGINKPKRIILRAKISHD